ncbi:hypothetical protein [Haliangium ochraceum]|uniref:Uncharacterized protein n=1 Tax=Haliangium ochraceum (strain DSM 14365 / JCM 11303 / SMP-2) TaxID=502025 RepID=D0LJY9_HALO1|nr:hypothetical protein [Haliangium ochraceum]ACY18496.1 hypothetical protein Hoch_6021 [Haliangium ochraceum DSM 14365]
MTDGIGTSPDREKKNRPTQERKDAGHNESPASERRTPPDGIGTSP